jgi:glycosyltransferase involved in cell wall biosynthesis
MRDRITKMISASRATNESLIARHGVDAERTSVIYEHVDVARVVSGAATPSREAIREELSIPADAFVVGGCGLVQIRKGIDAFVATKIALDHLRPGNNTHFVWVGHLDDYHCELMRLDLERANLTKTVHFIGERREPFAYFAAFDVFYLPSREDPFPVTCLEAAALGKPIIAFRDAGGMPEFIEDDCGIVVPYLDCASAAEALLRYLQHSDLRAQHGRRAQEKVQEYDIRMIGPQVVRLLEAVMGASR